MNSTLHALAANLVDDILDRPAADDPRRLELIDRLAGAMHQAIEQEVDAIRRDLQIGEPA